MKIFFIKQISSLQGLFDMEEGNETIFFVNGCGVRVNAQTYKQN